MTAVSEIGVSRTRSPKRSCSPRVSPKTLPPSPTSMPATNTRSSSASSHSSADRIASIVRKTGASSAGRGGSGHTGRGRVTKSNSVVVAGASSPRAASTAASSSCATDDSNALIVSSSMPADRRTSRVGEQRVARLPRFHLFGEFGSAAGRLRSGRASGRWRPRRWRARVRRGRPRPRRASPMRSRRRRCRRPRRSRRRIPRRAARASPRAGSTPVRTRRTRCSRRRRPPGSFHTAARFTASWNAPCATAPSPKNATTTEPSARSCAAVAAPTAIGRPAATIPLAPKMPIVGSAMCIEPPRPRFVPASLRHQLGEHPGRVETLRQAVAVTAMRRRDHVGRAERPARAHGRRLLPDRQVHEARDLAVAVQRRHPLLEPADHEHASMHLDEVGVTEHERCIVLTGTNQGARCPNRSTSPCPSPVSVT